MKKNAGIRVGVAAGLIATSALVGMVAQPEAQAGRGHRNGFSVADVRGSYGVVEWGTLQGQDWTEIAVIDSDGAGQMEIDFIGNIGGVTGVSGTLTCTYDVAPNGLGTMDCSGDEEVLVDFVLVDNAREIRFITAPGDVGLQAIGTARRQ